MKVCLVNALTISDLGSSELTIDTEQIEISAPLGILSLAAMLCDQCKDVETHIVNLNKLFYDYIKLDKTKNPPDYVTYIVEHVESISSSFDVLGLSSICSSYPLTLRIAKEYKERQKDAKVVLGGPQASVTDTATMEAFPAIDFIVRGEAEYSFTRFVKALSQKKARELESIKGITFRQGDKIIRTSDSDIILDLDSLPIPAYHLDPFIKEYKNISLEIGRGCPFNCTFCSTSNYFGRRFRLKSPQKIIEQMKFIKKTYGVTDISLDHDMFTANRKKVVVFCNALLDSGENFNWGCSARIDCVDNELISLMSKAGCKGIFFGIESGSDRLQKSINKNLNLSEAVDRIQHADKLGIKTAVSLITAFPDETEDELGETLNFFVDSLRFDNAEPQLGLLAPLAGSPMYTKYKDELKLDYVFSEMSFQGWKFDENDLELIRNNPEVFPDFYSIPNPWMDRKYFKEIRDFVTALQVWFRWIPVAMLQETGNMLKVCKRWMEWQEDRELDDHLDDGTPYYSHRQFADDFLEFVRDCYIKELSNNQLVISELAKTEGFFHPDKSDADEDNTEDVQAQGGSEIETGNEDDTKAGEKPEKFCISSFPFQPGDVRIVQLGVEYKELLECLRNKRSLQQVPEKNVTIAFREIFRGLVEIEVRQLTNLSKKLLLMCDGVHTVDDIIQHFSLQETNVNGVAAMKVGIFVLSKLFEQGIITVSSQPQRTNVHIN
jgi:radical SAM superfamily enzyme YgiQ (UPF0313 family)